MHHKKRGSGSRVSAGNLLNHILYKDGYLEKLITDNYESIYKYCCYHLNCVCGYSVSADGLQLNFC